MMNLLHSSEQAYWSKRDWQIKFTATIGVDIEGGVRRPITTGIPTGPIGKGSTKSEVKEKAFLGDGRLFLRS